MNRNRSISITPRADEFLRTYEAKLLREGHSMAFVEQFALEVFEVLFERLPKASLQLKPTYLGKDPHFHKYSLYAFSDGYVSGVYSSCGDHVVLLSLRVSLTVPAMLEVQARISAA